MSLPQIKWRTTAWDWLMTKSTLFTQRGQTWGRQWNWPKIWFTGEQDESMGRLFNQITQQVPASVLQHCEIYFLRNLSEGHRNDSIGKILTFTIATVGRVQPRCPCPYSNASVGWAASAGACGSKNQFYLLSYFLFIIHKTIILLSEQHREMMM